jgi:HD-like signal output (HDOD) protein
MFSELWRRLTGVSTPAPSPAPAPFAEAVASVPEPEPAPAAFAPHAPAPDPRQVAEAALHRSLNWRARVLLEGASKDARQSDGPELVEALRTANDSVIRQPPQAAMHALAVARNPDVPMIKVTALFENDPMLAQNLLRQANSVFYRRDGAPCTSLHSGVQRVGMKGVQSVLMTSMVQQMLCRPGSAFDSYVQKVWSHMQRSAPIARAIGPAFGIDAETAYSLALLHDVGKLVVFDHVSRMRHDHHRELKMPETFFRQLLYHLHEPIGGLAALRWDMGGEAAHAISEHHRRVVPETPDRATECLYVAECVELAHTNFTKLDWEHLWDAGGITTDVAQVQERLQSMEE